MHIGVLGDQSPIKPTDFVVLAKTVVVAALRVPNFIPHQEHGHSQRHHGDGQEVLHLPVPQLLNGRVIGRPFSTTVPTAIVVGAIAVSLAIVLVVFLVVRDQIIQCKTVVAGHEIDALLGLALLVAINLWTADHPVRHSPHRTGLAAEEVTNIVAETAVPLFPGVSHKAPT